jgi:hypothetical protein
MVLIFVKIEHALHVASSAAEASHLAGMFD